MKKTVFVFALLSMTLLLGETFAESTLIAVQPNTRSGANDTLTRRRVRPTFSVKSFLQIPVEQHTKQLRQRFGTKVNQRVSRRYRLRAVGPSRRTTGRTLGTGTFKQALRESRGFIPMTLKEMKESYNRNKRGAFSTD